MAVADVFRALGDPVRLEMVRRLSRPGAKPCTIAEISSGLGITRQGARKHLQVLVEARVAALEPAGRDVQVRLDRSALLQAESTIAELGRQWDARLAALQAFVEREE